MDTEHNNPSGGTQADARITATPVDDSQRLNTLPRYFGRHMLVFEGAVYGFMRRFASEYRGGYWHFYELSNGGFYMAPDRGRYRLFVETNGYEGVLSADAAGITACLFACSHLSFRYPLEEVFADRFHQLRDFAMEHSEAAQIAAAID